MRTIGLYLIGGAAACLVMWAAAWLYEDTAAGPPAQGWTYEQRIEDKMACVDVYADQRLDNLPAYNQRLARWGVVSGWEVAFDDAFCQCRTEAVADSLAIPWEENLFYAVESEIRFRESGWRDKCHRQASKQVARLKAARL